MEDKENSSRSRRQMEREDDRGAHKGLHSTPLNEPDNGDEQLIRLLRSGLDRLDELTPIREPDLHMLERQFAEHERTVRRRFLRDLALFLCTAAGILSIMAAAFFKLPAAFFAMQGAAVVVGPVTLFLHWRKRVKKS